MKKAFPYEVTKIGEGVHLINEKYSTMFVLEGTERALVIDCGTGVGDFKSVVEQITPFPYDLAVTHAHVDHIGGRGQFDKIFISAADAKRISDVTYAYRKLFSVIGKPPKSNIPRGSISVKRTEKEPEIHIIRQEDTFELGGRTVTVYETPGHTNGSVCFLDSKEKILFSGDVANPILFMWLGNCASIKDTVPTLERLCALEGYNTVWASHETAPLERRNIENCLNAVKKLSEKKNTLLPFFRSFRSDGVRVVYRTSRISRKE